MSEAVISAVSHGSRILLPVPEITVIVGCQISDRFGDQIILLLGDILL